MMYKYGGYYFANASIVCISDGENAYGIRSFGSDGKEGGEGKAEDICSWKEE